MVLANLDIILVILYFIIVLIIGIYTVKRQSKEDFLIAERKLGPMSLSASIAAGFIGGGFLVAYVSYVYQFGIAALWVFVGIVLGFFLLLIYHKRLKELADREEFYTISDYFKYKYGKNVGIISAVAIILYFLFFLIMEFIGGGRILAEILGIPYYVSILIMAVVILFYLGLGGFKSVVKTDVFQYFIILLFVIVIGVFMVSGTSMPQKEFSIGAMGIGTSIAFVILGAFSTFMAPDLWQRVYAAKNARTAKKSLYYSSGLIFVAGFVVALVGIVAKVNFPNIMSDEALVYGLSNLLPAGILGLGLVMLFAAIMSSVDTGLFVLGMSISEDITRAKIDLTKSQLIKITRFSIIGFTILSILIAIFVQNIISVALAFASISLCLIPSLLGSFHFRLKRKAVFISILTGIISVILILSLGYISPESSVISLPVSLVFLIIGQIVFKGKKHIF